MLLEGSDQIGAMMSCDQKKGHQCRRDRQKGCKGGQGSRKEGAAAQETANYFRGRMSNGESQTCATTGRWH